MDYEDISRSSKNLLPVDVSFSRLLSTLPNMELDQTGVTGICAWEKELQTQPPIHTRRKRKANATVS